MAKTIRQYEGMFLFGQSASQDNEGALATVRTMVERHEGHILHIKKWDERKLAYEIKKQKRGTYIICYFKAPSSSISAIERDVNLSDIVLRVMITGADHLNQKEMEAVEPQPIIREERPSWDRPPGDDRGGFRGGDRGDRPPREDRAPRPSRHDAPAEVPAADDKD